MGFIVVMLNTHMQESYTISKWKHHYILYNSLGLLLLYTRNKLLCYRYIYKLKVIDFTVEYQHQDIFQDISVDKPD
jgi:hypothetical protein